MQRLFNFSNTVVAQRNVQICLLNIQSVVFSICLNKKSTLTLHAYDRYLSFFSLGVESLTHCFLETLFASLRSLRT